MAENKSKRLFNLKETKTEFQCRGIVTGVEKKNFFSTKKTKNNSSMNLLSFGIQFDEGQTIYMTLNGIERPKVYYYNKSADVKTVAVDWKQRHNAPGEGYRLLGVGVGLEKGEDGNNIKYTMTDYDAAEYCSKHLKDGMSVFIKGNVEYSSYTTKDGEVKRSTKYVPNQISLCSSQINFEADDFEVLNDWKTNLVFDSIEKNAETNEFEVMGYDIGYSTIERVMYIIKDNTLANNFRKKLKPGYCIEATGKIAVETMIEEIETEDSWGERSAYDRVSSPTRRYMLLTGAKPSTVSTDDYPIKDIEDALKAIKNKENAERSFGESPKKNDDVPWEAGSSESELEDDWA